MGRCRPVSDSEADAMEAHCDGPEELALIRFFRHTAYRSNETASLVVSDLWDGHQVRDRVQIQAKHMKKKVSRRPIPIVPQLKQALVCWLMQLQQSGLLKPDTPIWLSRRHVSKMQGWTLDQGNPLAQGEGHCYQGRRVRSHRLSFLPQALLCPHLCGEWQRHYENGQRHGAQANQ
jgi:hypothetical protein